MVLSLPPASPGTTDRACTRRPAGPVQGLRAGGCPASWASRNGTISAAKAFCCAGRGSSRATTSPRRTPAGSSAATGAAASRSPPWTWKRHHRPPADHRGRGDRRLAPRWQERPVVVAVTDNGQQVPIEDIHQLLSGSFANWQLPDTVIYVDALPRTSVGKLDKKPYALPTPIPTARRPQRLRAESQPATTRRRHAARPRPGRQRAGQHRTAAFRRYHRPNSAPGPGNNVGWPVRRQTAGTRARDRLVGAPTRHTRTIAHGVHRRLDARYESTLLPSWADVHSRR